MWLCLAVLLLVAAPLRTSGAAEEPLYLIGPGDILEISVWNEPEFSRQITVRPDGRLSVPLVEDLPASGRTPEELARAIEERLSVYLQDPRVTITVIAALGVTEQRVRIVGEVAQPTSVPYRAGLTLFDAITEVGGLDPFADGNGAKIIRRTAQGEEEIPLRISDLVRNADPTANVALAPGDVIVIPQGFFTGNIQVDTNLNTTMTYTDNIDLDPDGEKDSAFLTRIGSGVNITADLARFTGQLGSNLGLVFEFDGGGPSLDGRLNATSTTELARDRVFFDFNAAYSRSLLDLRQSSSANNNVTTNRDTVITVSASPYVLHRLGDTVDAEWRYRISPVLTSSSGNSDSLTHTASNSLIGGEMLQFIGWTLESQAGQVLRTDEETIDFADTSLDMSYQLRRGFSLLGSIGYIYRSSDDSNDDDGLNGIAWDAGFRWEPTTRTLLEATIGQRDEDNTFHAILRHEIGPNTTIQATYRDERETDQESFIRGTNSVGFDDQGNPIDSTTGEPLDQDSSLTSFDDGTTRTKRLAGSIRHSSGPNAISLSASATRETGGNDGDEDAYRTTLTYGRSLTRKLGLTSSARYGRKEFSSDNREDDIYRFNVALSYQLYGSATGVLSYSFQDQDSTDSDEDFTENTASVGLTIGF